jgi:hypothetical protein
MLGATLGSMVVILFIAAIQEGSVAHTLKLQLTGVVWELIKNPLAGGAF